MTKYLLPLLLVACTSALPSSIELDGSASPIVDATSPTADASLMSPDILLHYRDTVAPGIEDVKCVDIPGPARDSWVTGWHVERHSGAHHAAVSLRLVGNQYTTPTKCSTDPASSKGLLLSTQPMLDFTLPGGAAILVPAGSSFIVETHELNTEAEPIEASVDFALHTTTDPGPVANLFVLIASGSNIPPAATKTLIASCPSPRDVEVLAITSHSHAHSTLVTGKVDGVMRYSSTTWAEPLAQVFDPPLPVKAGSTVTWACTVNNTTAATLTQCQNRDTCEMCELIGWAIMPETWSCRK